MNRAELAVLLIKSYSIQPSEIAELTVPMLSALILPEGSDIMTFATEKELNRYLQGLM